MMRVSTRLTMTTTTCAAVTALASAQMPTYRVFVIPPPDDAPMMIAMDLNNSNQVAGEALVDTEIRPLVSTDGETTYIDSIPGIYTTALAINDAARVSGWMYEWGVIWPQAYLWDGTQNHPLGQQGDGYSYGQGLNDRDHVVGYFFPPGGHTNGNAFINIEGVFHDLGSGQAIDVNNAGTVVGQINRYFGETAVWNADGSGAWNLTVLDGLEAMAINESGTIIAGVGPLFAYFDSAAIWTNEDGSWVRTDIGDWDRTITGSIANDVNDAGQVVGSYDSFKDSPRGFLYVDGNVHWLTDLLAPEFDGWHVTRAEAINESGTILAWASLNANEPQSVLLVPDALTLLGPRPGIAGEVNEIISVSATPGSQIYVVYSFSAGTTNVPGCPGLSVDLAAAQIAGTAVADSEGDARFSSMVPPAASGRTLLLQAVDVTTCEVSNVYRHTWR